MRLHPLPGQQDQRCLRLGPTIAIRLISSSGCLFIQFKSKSSLFKDPVFSTYAQWETTLPFLETYFLVSLTRVRFKNLCLTRVRIRKQLTTAVTSWGNSEDRAIFGWCSGKKHSPPANVAWSMDLSLAIEASCGLRLKLLVFLLRFSLSSKINISKFQFDLEIKLSPIFRDTNRATVFLIHFFQFDF